MTKRMKDERDVWRIDSWGQTVMTLDLMVISFFLLFLLLNSLIHQGFIFLMKWIKEEKEREICLEAACGREEEKDTSKAFINWFSNMVWITNPRPSRNSSSSSSWLSNPRLFHLFGRVGSKSQRGYHGVYLFFLAINFWKIRKKNPETNNGERWGERGRGCCA